MRRQLSGFEVTVDDEREPCETELVPAGAYVIAVTTVLPGRGTLLASSFLSDLDGNAAATHLWSGAPAARFEHDLVRLAGVHQARTCVLEHAAVLSELLTEHLPGARVQVQVGDHALAHAEEIWRP